MDDKRKAALDSGAKVRLIEGAAGSGKTHFGCHLALHELDSGGFVQQHQGILFLTFARNAVARISEVMCGQTSGERRRDFQKRTKVETFCAFFWWLVECYGRYRVSGTTERLWLVGQKNNQGIYIPPGHLPYTFADIESSALETVRIPAVLDLIAELWPLIVVDEFQDVDDTQYDILSVLGRHTATKLVLLSGPGQAMYRWRGANPEETRERCIQELAPAIFPIEQMSEKGKRRFSPEVESVVQAFQNSSEYCVTRQSAVTYRAIPDDGRPNLYSLRAGTAVQDFRDNLKRKLGRTPTVAVLGATNRVVCSVSRCLREGNDVFRLRPTRTELRLDDPLLMSYGRLMLEMLETHWLFGKKTKAEPSQHAAAQLTELAYSANTGNVKVSSNDWSHLSSKMLEAFSRQKSPTDGQDCCSKLLKDLTSANEWLCKTQKDLSQAGFPKGAQWTPFNGSDKGILLELAMHFLEAIRPIIVNGTPDRVSARQHFESHMKKRILYEKIGLSASLEAMTIHKAKGREFDGVVLVLEDEHGAPWKGDQNSDSDLFDLYYVAISRARHALMIVAKATAGREIRSCVRHLLPVSKFPTL